MVSHTSDSSSVAPEILGKDDPERIATAIELAAITLDYDNRSFSKDELWKETRTFLRDGDPATTDDFESVLRGMPELLYSRENGLFSLRPVS